ncbi:MAG: Holliday junction resolvase RuvX [Candidatus Muirbacterium halophilum]|nr:Holliday junction resolvase RuvX [Candidatus Muirbacterium halophilum]
MKKQLIKGFYFIMRIMALDYGFARIGIALSDESGTIASPFTTIKNENSVKKIKTLVEEKKVDKIIIGIPSDHEGNDTIQSEKVRNFFNKIKDNIDVCVELFDENYTTRDAYDILKEVGYSMKKSKKLVDEFAASIILREYIKWSKNQSS